MALVLTHNFEQTPLPFSAFDIKTLRQLVGRMRGPASVDATKDLLVAHRCDSCKFLSLRHNKVYGQTHRHPSRGVGARARCSVTRPLPPTQGGSESEPIAGALGARCGRPRQWSTCCTGRPGREPIAAPPSGRPRLRNCTWPRPKGRPGRATIATTRGAPQRPPRCTCLRSRGRVGSRCAPTAAARGDPPGQPRSTSTGTTARHGRVPAAILLGGHRALPSCTWFHPKGRHGRVPIATPLGGHRALPSCTFFCPRGRHGRATIAAARGGRHGQRPRRSSRPMARAGSGRAPTAAARGGRREQRCCTSLGPMALAGSGRAPIAAARDGLLRPRPWQPSTPNTWGSGRDSTRGPRGGC